MDVQTVAISRPGRSLHPITEEHIFLTYLLGLTLAAILSVIEARHENYSDPKAYLLFKTVQC